MVLKSKAFFILGLGLVLLLAVLPFASACAATPAPASAPSSPTAKPVSTPAPVSQAATAAQQVKQIRFLGSSAGGTVTLLFAKWAEVLGKELGIPVGVFPGGTMQNFPVINRGDAEFAYASTYDLDLAIRGGAPLKEPYRNLSWVWCFSPPNPMHACVWADSSIRAMRDIIGKKVSLGSKGTLSDTLPQLEWEAGWGFTAKDIEAAGGVVVWISSNEQQTRFADKTVDVTFHMAGTDKPDPVAIAVEQRSGVRVIPYDEEASDKIVKKYPFLVKVDIKGGVYKNHPKPVPTLGINTLVACRSDLPEDVVYKVLKALYTSAVIKDTRALAGGEFYNFGDKVEGCIGANLAPVHPGAVKFWKEYGGVFPTGAKLP